MIPLLQDKEDSSEEINYGVITPLTEEALSVCGWWSDTLQEEPPCPKIFYCSPNEFSCTVAIQLKVDGSFFLRDRMKSVRAVYYYGKWSIEHHSNGVRIILSNCYKDDRTNGLEFERFEGNATLIEGRDMKIEFQHINTVIPHVNRNIRKSARSVIYHSN